MLVEIQMPRMGQSMEEGTVVEWLVKVGDQVKKGDPIAEIETDKAVITFESNTNGKVDRIVVAPGDVVPVGTTLALIEDGKEETVKKVVPETEKPSEMMSSVPLKEEVQPVFTAEKQVNENLARTDRVIASPVAKRLAQELGIDISKISGTGPGGMISKKDIEMFSSKQPTEKLVHINEKTQKPVQLSKIKRITADRMTHSKQNIPHFYISMDINMGEALKLRESLNRRGYEVSINDLIIKAAALSLVEYPNLNATFSENQVVQHEQVDIAVAVTIDEGLITPIIKNCEKLSLYEISKKAKAVIERARVGNLQAEDVESGTFTVSNLGMFGVKEFSAIINPPQAAILAVSRVQQVPVFDSENNITSAAIMNVTVSADHRVTDGVEVAKFLQKLQTILEDSYSLL